MNNEIKSFNKDLYYSNDHDWIYFQESVAYIGVSGFKLIGFREIQEIIFKEPLGIKKRGEVIATIKSKEYYIKLHMPVDGKVIQINEKLLTEERNVLLQQPESGGWIALIVPVQPNERKDLMLSKQYHMLGKSKYDK